MHLQNVKISGFWGEYEVEFHLDRKMNIIIGKNGTGKTQILNLIEAALTCDVDTLYRIDFDSIRIDYSSSRKPKTILIEKRLDKSVVFGKNTQRSLFNRYAGLVYHLDAKGYLIIDSQGARSRMLVEAAQNEKIDLIPFESMRDLLLKMFNTVVLNVHRSNRITSDEEYVPPSRRRMIKDILNDRIEVILNRITSDQVKLKDELAVIAKDGEKRFVSSLLFDDTGLTYQMRNISRDELMNKNQILRNTLSEMGILDQNIILKIDDVFREMESIADKDVSKMWKSQNKNVGQLSNIIRWMSLISKLEILSGVSSEIEKQKNSKMQSWNLYLSLLSDFMGGKYFDFDEEGRFRAFVGKRSVDISHLSSGEKQIFVMLSEAYLENRGEHIFLADEPELSLHLEWQQNIVPAMQKLNTTAQYIIVTHSLEIAGSYPENIIDMDEVMA